MTREDQQPVRPGNGKPTTLAAHFSASLAAIALWALVVAATASAGTLDQSQTDFDDGSHGLTVGGTATPAQTFTPGRSGLLDRVDVWVQGFSGCSADLIVQIRSAAEGPPAALVLATSTIQRDDIGTRDTEPAPVPAPVSVSFPAPTSVAASTQYAIVLSTATDFLPCYVWFDADADAYGQGLQFGGQNGVFTVEPQDDFAFRTYVCDAPCVTTCSGREATLLGTSGNDTLLGTPGPDVIAARGGKDIIRGLGGDDRICGENGNDVLRGGAGRDRLIGGANRDKCIGGPGRDRARGCEVRRSL